MVNPFKRNASRRPALRPAPGTQRFEVDTDPAIEISEGNEDSDWAMWEDSVQQVESGAMPLDPFESIKKRDA